MTIDFSELKNKRGTSLDTLNSAMNKMSNTNNYSSDDDQYWKPEVDKVGNGYAVIRFLPAPAGEDVPFVRIWDHGFQGPGGWYIERSLTTLGQDDPVSEYNSKLWNSGVEKNKEIARKQKRRLKYISNIYVVKDPANPQNEGKVFLYSFGKKIFEKINDAMNPRFPDEQPINPFDFWEGANFKIKIRKVEGWSNYDTSEFADPSQLADDSQLESIWKQQHSLKEIIDPKNFKSYDELKSKLNKVLGVNVPSVQEQNVDSEYSAMTPAETSFGTVATAAAVGGMAGFTAGHNTSLDETLDDDIPWDTPSTSSDSSGTDDIMAEYERLANG